MRNQARALLEHIECGGLDECGLNSITGKCYYIFTDVCDLMWIMPDCLVMKEFECLIFFLNMHQNTHTHSAADTSAYLLAYVAVIPSILDSLQCMLLSCYCYATGCVYLVVFFEITLAHQAII